MILFKSGLFNALKANKIKAFYCHLAVRLKDNVQISKIAEKAYIRPTYIRTLLIWTSTYPNSDRPTKVTSSFHFALLNPKPQP